MPENGKTVQQMILADIGEVKEIAHDTQMAVADLRVEVERNRTEFKSDLAAATSKTMAVETEVKTDISALKVKATGWGAFGGILGAIATAILGLLIRSLVVT